MKHRSSSSYGLSAGIALATAMADAGLYIFSTDDAQRLAPADVPAGRVPYLLKLLADAGWLIRLRRDLYAGTGRLPGSVDVPPFAIATSLVAPSAISHWSALAHHGLTDQVPVVVTATTTRRVVTPRMRVSATLASPATPAVHATPTRREPAGIWRVAGIDCRYVTVVPDRYFGIEPVWLDQRFRVAITDRERTVLDLFAMPRLFGGISEGLAVLERTVDELDLARLIAHALRYDSVAVAKRLGWSLERVGIETSALAPLLDLPASSYGPLDPGRPRRGSHDRRWMILNNLSTTRA